jgi:hypothetical protein
MAGPLQRLRVLELAGIGPGRALCVACAAVLTQRYIDTQAAGRTGR